MAFEPTSIASMAEEKMQRRQRGQRVGQFASGPPNLPGLDDFSGSLAEEGNWAQNLLGGADWESFVKSNWTDVIGWGLRLGGAVYDAFTTSPREELEKEILAARRERLTDLRRQATGDFTESERAQVMRAYAPVHERVATNLAMRGIEGSGAAGQILAEAEQAPFRQLQQQAQVQLDQYELQTFKLAYELLGEDDTFFQDLSDFVGEMGRPDTEDDMALAELNKTMTDIQETWAGFRQELQTFASELEN